MRADELFAPHWKHVVGLGLLGRSAFHAGQWEIAERFLLALRDKQTDNYRGEEMSMLATIWHARGEGAPARELLVECLRKSAQDLEKSTDDFDRNMLGSQFQHHRSTYLQLFPEGRAELLNLGLPDEPG